MMKTAKTVETVRERERERERVSLKNIGFIFDAENAEKITTNNSCLVNEYINEKWIDYVKTNFVKEIRRLFLQNSLSFLCEFNI